MVSDPAKHPFFSVGVSAGAASVFGTVSSLIVGVGVGDEVIRVEGAILWLSDGGAEGATLGTGDGGAEGAELGTGCVS